MKQGIHPKSEDITITCTCGAKVRTASTLCKDVNVELCSKCHPFFTGKQRLVDSTGRVERFQKRMEKYKAAQKGKGKGKAKVEVEAKAEANPETENQ